MWTHTDKLYGCTIQAAFFDNKVSDKETDFVKRVLPIVSNPQTINVLYSENDRKNFYHEHIVAQPDAVLSQDKHMISLEYKTMSGREHDPAKWQHTIRLKDILQTVINSLQVSFETKKVTIPLLRYANVIYFIQPSEEICDLIMNKAQEGKSYFEENKWVSSSQLSEYLEPFVKRKYPLNHSGSEQGVKMHEQMLRK